MSGKRVQCADLFCGAGGTSTGLVRAAGQLGLGVDLVEPCADGARLDIRFRMLQPHELAAAMGFEGYEFAGTKTDRVKQIGNAVPVNTAAALCRTILEDVA